MWGIERTTLRSGLAAHLVGAGRDRGRAVARASALLSHGGRAVRTHRLQTSPERRLRLGPDQALHAPGVSTEHDERRPGPHREAPIGLWEACALVVGVDDYGLEGLGDILEPLGERADDAVTLVA